MSKGTLGFVYALLAFASWGLFPLYWREFAALSPIEVVSHRVIWSVLVLLVAVYFTRQMGEARAVVRNWRLVGMLFVTAALLSINWGVFIYAVAIKQVVQSSLGYFLNPLVTILLGLICLKERLGRLQITALVLAAAGVLHFGWHLGHMPWIALALAFSFGFYGLLRKIVAVTPLVGLLVETALMVPFALGGIAIIATREQHGFGSTPYMTGLFLIAGILTTLPLFWFNSAAKLLPLSTMGFLHYLTPTLQLLLGVLVFKEEFTSRQAVSFLLIWVAIMLYLYTLIKAHKAEPLAPPVD